MGNVVPTQFKRGVLPEGTQQRLEDRFAARGDATPNALGVNLEAIRGAFQTPKRNIPPAPSLLDPSVSASVRRRRASATAAAGATILTGSQGLTSEAATTKKSLLGT